MIDDPFPFSLLPSLSPFFLFFLSFFLFLFFLVLVFCLFFFLTTIHSSVGKESTCNAQDPGLIPGSGRFSGEGIGYPLQHSWASLVAQQVKTLPAMREAWVWSLGWDDPLEKWKATHSSILDWRFPGTVKSMGSQGDWDFRFPFSFIFLFILTHAPPRAAFPNSTSCFNLRICPWEAIFQTSDS